MRDLQKFRKYFAAISLQDVFLIVLPILLLINTFVFVRSSSAVEKKITGAVLYTSPVKESSVAPYPILRIKGESSESLLSSTDSISFISANAAEVLDNDSQVVLFSKNPTAIFSMASTTKIMTALVALDYYKDSDILTIKSANIPPAIVGFSLGERVYFKDMLYGMMLASGNDAAVAIAQNYMGGESAFINAMNNKALSLGLYNTRFSDSSGLNERNVTTASDLARLSSYAMKNSYFAKVVGTKQYMVPDVSGKVHHPVTNLNKLLGIDGVNGIKTGYTEEAGEVLATSRIMNGHDVIVVVMKSDNRFLDTQNILSFINKNINYLQIDSLTNADGKVIRGLKITP